MAKNRTRRQRAILKRRIFLGACAAVLALAIFLIALAVKSLTKRGQAGNDTSSGKQSTTTSEAAPEPIPETSVTVLSTGDIMTHNPQLAGAYNRQTDEYDFHDFFKACAPYFKAADLAVANLEVTFGSKQSGKYNGYPAFNCPDSLADAIKDSGLNFLITANNHSYDTGLFGLKRTASVLKEKQIEFTGTKELPTDPAYVVKEINNIKIGIANFTYETDGQTEGRKYLNGMILAEEANDLINSFSYKKLDAFYALADEMIADMKADGADYILFYIHWGEEYQTKPNTWQKTIAQQLSNRGVNMIIGSHPHVIQPVELITPEGGEGYTVCLYSTGNYISNQRQEVMVSCPSGHTEDGMLFSFTLTKSADGTALTGLDLVPTWVNKYSGGGGYLYTAYPMESPDDGSSKYGFSSASAARAKKSYERTKAIVAEGLTECQNAIGCTPTFQ